MEYISHIKWHAEQGFDPKTYDRTHEISFAGGEKIAASSAKEFGGKAAFANPEELFTASLSSCFMLSFFHLAAMKGLALESYEAKALGKLGKNDQGKMAMLEVTITPQFTFQADKQPDANLLKELVKKAHDTCFISNSVKTTVTIDQIN